MEASGQLRRGVLIAALAAVLTAALPAAPAGALDLRVVGRFRQPVYVTAPPGQSARLFVVERGGRIIVVRRGRKLARPFLDLRRSVRFFEPHSIERDQGGLLSMAFPPDYRHTRRFYVVYTTLTEIRVEEFRRSRPNPYRAQRSSRRMLLRVARRSRNDLGGQLQFGPDGMLYVGLGYGRDPDSSQDLSRLTGKLLRIDPWPAGGLPYRIPADNPFAGRPG